MGKKQATIREPTLRELIEANSIRSAYVVGQKGGFAVAFRYAMTERFLASTRGGIRIFSNLTTVATYLRKLGVSRFDVDTANYEPGRLRPARPDRAEALKKTRTRLRQADLLESPRP
jgi:hypothetical protein